ncbi:MAG: serine/threonine-protein kinase, partial [Deltaproteobacteria bacterium]|nr:serine/threonine-protein kinase [Deltaproteobacteria bacterium]
MPSADASTGPVSANTLDPITMYRARAQLKAELFGHDAAASCPRIDRYELLEQIGQGGFGTVFRARDPRLGRDVAVKVVVLDGHDAGPGAIPFDEARVLARLRHPGIVTVFDVGTCDASDILGPSAARAVYIVMELLHGCSLGRWRSTADRSVQEIVKLHVQAGRGVAAAHEQGVVHLDLKPANIHVEDGRASVLDFGVAKLLDRTLQTQDARDAVQVMGTPRYMAPEQHLARPLGPATDQFALATCLFETLFEGPAFEGSDPAEIAAAKLRGPPPIPTRRGLTARQRRALHRALSPRPSDRFESVAAFVDALRPDRRRRRRAAAVAITGALAVGAGLGLLGRPDPCDHVETQAEALWNEQTRTAMEASFLRHDVPYAPASLEAARETVDRRMTQWAELRTQACRENETASPEHPSAMAYCLDRYYEQVRAVLGVLEEADLTVVRRVHRALEGLGGLEHCVVDRALPPPPSWLVANPTEGLAIDAQLMRARALLDAGKAEAARADLTEIRERANQLPAPALEAEAALLQCSSVGPFEGRAFAREVCDEALLIAERNSQPTVATEVLLHIAALYGGTEPMKVQHFVELARAKRAQLPADPILDARMEWLTAEILLAYDEREQAIVALEHAREVFIAEQGRRSTSAIGVSNSIGLALARTGHCERATQELAALLPIVQATYGPGHPTEGAIVNNLGRACSSCGDSACAVTSFETALAIKERANGPTSPALLTTLGNLAHEHQDLGDRRRALDYDLRGLEIARQTPDEGPAVRNFEANALELQRTPGDAQSCRALEQLLRQQITFDGVGDTRLTEHVGRCWIEAGAPDDPGADPGASVPQLLSLDLYPPTALLEGEAAPQ